MRAIADASTLVRSLRIVFAALSVGVLIFALVVLAMALFVEPERAVDEGLPFELLSLVNAGLAVTLWSVGGLLLGPLLLRRPLAAGEPEQQRREAFQLVGIAALTRLICFEASALLGLLLCLLASQQGALQEQPLYALNALPAAVMLLATLLTWPDVDQFDQRAGELLRHR